MCRERRGQNVKIEKSISDRIERKVTLTTEADKTATLSPSQTEVGGKRDRADRFGAESQFQTDLQRFRHRRQKWGPGMAEQTDSGQKVNFRENRKENCHTERTQNESPKSRQKRE